MLYQAPSAQEMTTKVATVTATWDSATEEKRKDHEVVEFIT